jgi:DNA polymerase (family 10)
MMDKKQVARILEEIGALLELEGENPFKSRAYFNAARIVRGLEGDLATAVRSGRLREIKGIGETLHENVSELAEKGRLRYYDELRAPYPPAFMEMLQIPGLGPRKVKALWETLRIGSLDELENACRENRLAALDGFGAKTQERILKGIGFRKRHEGLYLADFARREGEALIQSLTTTEQVIQISLAGSIRRRSEIVRNLNLVVASAEPQAMLSRFAALPEVDRITLQSDAHTGAVLSSGIAVDVRVISPAEFPHVLRHLTGSVPHNHAMRARAERLGMRLDEHGLYRGDVPVSCTEEPEIFAALGLTYIPPELREDSGEIEAAAAGTLPRLVEEKEIRGAIHVHSTWSDGKDTLEEMVRAAADLGYRYIGISDHSKSAFYANGLSEDRVGQQHEEIVQLQTKYPQIRILRGIESDILQDGSLDYPGEVLDSFDFVVASVHSRFGMSEAEMTTRVIRALENPHTCILGHPTGRLLLEREPYHVKIESIVDAAVMNGVAIEINASPQRLDLDWRFARRAAEKGAMFSIDLDAHNVRELSDVSFGVGVARKAWLNPEQILNTRDVDEFLAFIRKNSPSKC